jgi:SAM-dependent methyltransferase
MTTTLVVVALVAFAVAFVRRRWLMAVAYDRIMAGYERHQGARREALVAEVEGTVLEIGPGTGVNLPLLAARAAAGVPLRWIGVEPNPAMRTRLERRAGALGFPIELPEPTDGRLPAEDGSCDVVLATLVLCSVTDPEGLLAEVRRVLRPGGRFLFLEHVAAERGTGVRRWQERLAPLWSILADGCRLDRETEARIRAAGFARVEAEAFPMPREAVPAVLSPHLLGRAIR